ncbi:MAG: integral rane sensor signal transduction histidine kinase [Sphingomonas bacterium]|nr:integral rane sensor signal transduction histidine kinase [Sphingomonas bacterium]
MIRRGMSLFAQTVILLLMGLLLAQAVTVVMVISRPPPRPDIHGLTEIAERLTGRIPQRRSSLMMTRTARPPAQGELVEDPRLTALLAELTGRPPGAVRLYYEADQSASFPFRRHRRERGVTIRRGEPVFFNAVVGAVRQGDGWRVARTPPKPFLNVWQKWTLIWFGLTTLLLVPLAWIFARRLTRPMRRFVEAADGFGREAPAPALPVEGPKELRTAAEALNRMQARIDEHIRERTSMIGAIAHDLRTPLARIAFRIEAAPDAMREKVQADVEQMRTMIAETIAFVRGASAPFRPERIDLAALIGRIAEQAKDTGRPVSFEGAPPAWVMGDALSLERLIDNLVNNAVAFGGAAEIVIARTGRQVAVMVRDRGPGLSEAMLDRAFEPFERGEPSRSRSTGGVGLGLTIARAIARTHGGTLALANRVGGGLEARLILPADDPGTATNH